MTNSNAYKYYDVLGCSKHSTHDEIKRAYKKLALMYHPDKSTRNVSDNDKFLRIEEAWRVLSDVDERKKYDADCRQAELEANNVLIYDTIRLDAMTKSEDGIFCYPCRCGSIYAISNNDLKEFDEVHVPCQECTFLLAIEK